MSVSELCCGYSVVNNNKQILYFVHLTTDALAATSRQSVTNYNDELSCTIWPWTQPGSHTVSFHEASVPAHMRDANEIP